ncbi:hypothetical protein GOV05_02220 [Candidatus Woesearchaeota archaeon]|nr:hypothetical protein [Candidatus Woesearchaeota archaeon]
MLELLSEVVSGFLTIFVSPSNDWSVFWLLAPIFLFWVVLEFYFDKHKKEELGWNTALGNGLSLFWVAISCVKYIFTLEFTMQTFWRTFWIFTIFSYALFIISMSFSHQIKDKQLYLLASPTPIYYLSAVLVLLSYGVLEFTWIILFDLAFLYGAIIGLEVLIKKIIPEPGAKRVVQVIKKDATPSPNAYEIKNGRPMPINVDQQENVALDDSLDEKNEESDFEFENFK